MRRGGEDCIYTYVCMYDQCVCACVLYVCICIGMYMQIPVQIYHTYIHTYEHTYIRRYFMFSSLLPVLGELIGIRYDYWHIHIYMHNMRIHVCVCVGIYMRVYIYINAYACRNLSFKYYAYIHTYKHTYIRRYFASSSLLPVLGELIGIRYDYWSPAASTPTLFPIVMGDGG